MSEFYQSSQAKLFLQALLNPAFASFVFASLCVCKRPLVFILKACKPLSPSEMIALPCNARKVISIG